MLFIAVADISCRNHLILASLIVISLSLNTLKHEQTLHVIDLNLRNTKYTIKDSRKLAIVIFGFTLLHKKPLFAITVVSTKSLILYSPYYSWLSVSCHFRKHHATIHYFI